MDPKNIESLKLTKAEVLGIIDRRIKEWSKNKKENLEYIIEGHAVKFLISRAKEEKFGHFWGVLLNDIDSIRYQNEKKTLPKVFSQINDSNNTYNLNFTKGL